ncbi:sodium-dependent transporter [Flavonifractor sp. AGMB03687]|uniref:sodium-dependent transporter n=1 Tax=Flavonifractor sp. AGMB03687 TaxID=2785133 RepID=UPI001AE0D2C8|nr:sodium-dependent transporter [Flavonifractor sp. AGMB03687]
MAAPDKTLETRDGFKSKWGFILACIGSAVGMGNIWRFPIMVSTYGGMTFLLPYFLFVVLIGMSGVMEEFALGRAAGAGPIGAFGYATEDRTGKKKVGEAIGLLPVLGSMGLAIGYTVVLSWIFKYAFDSITGSMYAMGTDMATIGGAFGAIAPENANLIESVKTVFSGEAGNTLWLVIGLVVSIVIMALGVSGGIEKANKIMMPVLFGLFLILAVYIATLPGASEGYKYILTLNPAGLLNPNVWIFAFGQAFFSLSVAGNGSVIYGSYLPKNEDIGSSARNVAIFDTLAALLAAFVIIPAMAVGGGDLTKGGPGLMFVWLVNVFNGMPGGRIVGAIFFICVLFAGVSSIINLYEAPAATLQEVFHFKRLPAVLTIGVIGAIIAVCIQGITSPWMDAVSIYICPLGAALAGVMFFWVLTKEKALAAINEGAKKPIGKWFLPLGKFVYVPLCIVALVAGAALGGIG